MITSAKTITNDFSPGEEALHDTTKVFKSRDRWRINQDHRCLYSSGVLPHCSYWRVQHKQMAFTIWEVNSSVLFTLKWSIHVVQQVKQREEYITDLHISVIYLVIKIVMFSRHIPFQIAEDCHHIGNLRCCEQKVQML